MSLGLGLGIGLNRRRGGGITDAIVSIGDSLAGQTGATNYAGTALATRVYGPFSPYARSGVYYPGFASAYIRARLAEQPLIFRRSVVIIWSGRNDIGTDPIAARTEIQGMVNDLIAVGNTRTPLFVEIPWTTVEFAAGPGNAGYDAVLAHNVWLAATFGAGHVITAQAYANTYPSGDTVHIANAGYDVICMDIVTKLKALGYLYSAIPTTKAQNSLNCSAIGKYLWAQPPDATHDTLPQTPAAAASSWGVWLKFAAAGSAGVIFGRYGNVTNTTRVGLRYSGGSLFCWVGNNVFTSGVTAVPQTGWNLIGLTVNGASSFMTLNGAQVGSTITSAALSAVWNVTASEVSDLPVMGGSGGSFALLGKYYQPMIWSSALSVANWLTLYNGGVALAPSASPSAANIVWCPNFDAIQSYSLTRGVPDYAGTLDARVAVGMTSADLSTDIP